MNVYLFYAANNRLWKHFPNSVLALTNPLIDAGFNPVIVDVQLQDWRSVPIEKPVLFGFSIYTRPTIAQALEIAAELRRRYPDVPIAWGGPHVIMLPEQTAAHPLVDAACYGEGEETIVALAKACAVGPVPRTGRIFSSVPGICWKDANKGIRRNAPARSAEMDTAALYPYRLLDASVYPLHNSKMYYEASRGCPYRCRFCSYDHTKWRPRSAAKVIADLTAIEAQFSPSEIQLVDANHFMDIRWVEEIWSRKLKAGLKFKWETNCRFDTLARIPDALLALLKRSGCYQLRLGAESGSQKILDYLDKGVKAGLIVSGVGRCREQGINTVVSFMTGYPPEEREDLQATTDMIDTLRRRFPGVEINGLFQFVPYPNTDVFKEITKTYAIPLPKTLDEWGERDVNAPRLQDFPWLTPAKYRACTVLSSIVSYLFFSDRLISMPAGQANTAGIFRFRPFLYLFRAADWIIRSVFVPLRWKKKVMAFPVEWYLWNFVRMRILKLF